MATEERRVSTRKPPWRGLTARPSLILDVVATRAALDAVAVGGASRGDARKAGVEVLRQANAEGRAAIAAAIAAAPRAAHRAIHDYAWLVDQIVTLTLDFAARWLHPLPNPTSSERIAALAVGGYGRFEMAPFSDVDLLFVTPYKQTAWGESLIESVLYCLWDLRLKVGHSARTIDDCLRFARSDATVRTSLLEHRYVWGDRPLARRLDERLWAEVFASTGPQFVEMKLAERAARHERQGSSRYLLEPNVKEGKGGLRDLQTLYWIAKYLNHAKSTEDLAEIGVFSRDEYRIFTAAEDFLWTTRVHLHLLTGRASEQLTFDTQMEIAAVLGYRSTRAQRGVERYMQDYFTHAKAVGDLTRIFLAALEARHVKTKPGFGQKLRRVFARGGKDPTGRAYRLNNGRLDLADPDAFARDPVNILRLFQEALATDIPIHPDALRRVAASLKLIDERVRKDPEANRIFIELLLGHNNPEGALRLMNEVGVLGAFIPEFGRIVAMMQFNMYHYYTVDEHTIRTMSTLSQIERGELVDDLPVATDILERGVNRKVLYLALLLHDIGKGSGRDHSTVGAEVAARLGTRFGLDDEDTALVVWLVQHHLLMSDTAQKRDLTDPRTARDFAVAVKSPTRLKLLTVLTVCDIRGVGPGVWNNWKAMLLRSLYADTMEVMTGGTQQSRPDRAAAAREALAAKLPGWPAMVLETELARHYPPYWLGFDAATHFTFAELLRDLEDSETAMRIEQDFSRDATQACFAMADHPGIFARLAGALALAGANVVDARTYTSTDGFATAAFWIQDAEGKPYERARLTRLRNSVTKTLRGEIVARDALKDKDRIRKRERGFVVPTRIDFDNNGSDIYTIIEIETRDRPGLLYDLARTLTANNVSIASAIIATYGEIAVDVFYVKDLFGLKLQTESKRRALDSRLRAVIDGTPR